MNQTSPHNRSIGLAYATAAFAAWGIAAPIYFRAVKDIPALEVLCHRVVWAAILLVALIHHLKRWPMVRDTWNNKRSRTILAATSVIIALNWLTYIYAVATDQLAAASFGYFISPLVMILLARFVLGEQLRKVQWIAIAIATVGVTIKGFSLGYLPWIPLALAGTFGLYGLIRKQTEAGPIVGLAFETTALFPLALLYLFLTPPLTNAPPAFGSSINATILLILAAPMTALPLLWFAAATTRLNLSTIGLMQYLGPTLQLVMATVFFNEPFEPVDWAAFGVTWLSIAIFVGDSLRSQKQTDKAQPTHNPDADCIEPGAA